MNGSLMFVFGGNYEIRNWTKIQYSRRLKTKFNTRHIHIHTITKFEQLLYQLFQHVSVSSLVVFCLILPISLPPHHFRCPNCPLLLNSSKSRL